MTVISARPATLAVVHPDPAPSPEPPAPPQAMALITALLEAMMGRRPLHQLRPHLDLAAFGHLVCYVDEGAFRRMTVGSVRTQMPTGRAVEASVRLRCASRWISCVIRLDVGQRAWRCTDLTVLQPS